MLNEVAEGDGPLVPSESTRPFSRPTAGMDAVGGIAAVTLLAPAPKAAFQLLGTMG